MFVGKHLLREFLRRCTGYVARKLTTHVVNSQFFLSLFFFFLTVVVVVSTANSNCHSPHLSDVFLLPLLLAKVSFTSCSLRVTLLVYLNRATVVVICLCSFCSLFTRAQIMGCGVSQAVLQGNDDVSKSNAFIRLCTDEKNPFAIQLNNYFNALMSECLYKSQGDMNGYERLLAKRPEKITVNRNRLEAQHHGIGRKPLTVDGVNDIMNLFLGHVIKSLQQRKWSGSFNYVIMQPQPDLNATRTDGTQGNPFSATLRSASPKNSAMRNSTTSATRKKEVAAADPPADSPATAMPSSRKSSQPTFNVTPSITVRGNALVFVDQGNGSRRDDDPSWQWRMELTGNITYFSVDGALTLICDCKVAFLFFTCDTSLPPAQHNTNLKEGSPSSSQNTPLKASSAPACPSMPTTNAVEHLGPVVQPASVPETEGRTQGSPTGPNARSDERVVQDLRQAKPMDSTPITAASRAQQGEMSNTVV